MNNVNPYKASAQCTTGVLTITDNSGEYQFKEYSLKIKTNCLTIIGQPKNMVFTPENVEDWDAFKTTVTSCNL